MARRARPRAKRRAAPHPGRSFRCAEPSEQQRPGGYLAVAVDPGDGPGDQCHFRPPHALSRVDHSGWTGKWLGGRASREAIGMALAWSMVPIAWSLLLWIPELLIFGTELFSHSAPVLPPAIALPVIQGRRGGAGVLGVGAAAQELGQVQGFSAWRAWEHTAGAADSGRADRAAGLRIQGAVLTLAHGPRSVVSRRIGPPYIGISFAQ